MMKHFQLFVMIIMIFVLGTNLVPGAGGKGAAVKVRLNDGQELKGELLTILDRNLVLFDRIGEKELRVSIDRVTQLSILRKPTVGTGFLNGMGIGMIYGIYRTASNRDTHYDYAQFVPILSGALGGLLGGLGTLIPRPSKKYDLQDMSAEEVRKFLVFLRRFTREEYVYKSLLGRFRLSWRPFFHPSSPIKIRGECQVAADSSPLDPRVFNYEFHMISRKHSLPNRTGRVRLDYVLRNWLSLGFEYVNMGQRYVGGSPDLELIHDQQSYRANLGFTGTYKASAVLLEMNMGKRYGTPAGFRYELGIGLSFSSMTLRSGCRGTLSPGPEHSFRWVTLALQPGFSWEFSPRARLSTGIYGSYLYIPAFFPGLQASGSLDFAPDTEARWSDPTVFTRDVVLNIPKSRINLGGFSLGVFIRLR
jgi:hypothetical protein